jgi:uncharacterized heparinase superfamily protein
MLVRYWHTLRYLRLIQIVGRLQYFFKRPVIDESSIELSLKAFQCEWVSPAQRSRRMLDYQSFCFLNKTHKIKNAADWNSTQCTKLWLYNLHYFDDLTAIDAENRTEWHRELINRWIDENPPGNGNGWEPYPSSLRIVNWIKWALAGNQLNDRFVNSLVIQIRFLTQNLETHLLGNHLFANAKALIFAGLFFEGDESKKWYHLGRTLVERELPEQVLNDGGNFELSTMYHMIFLEDLLDLVNLHRTYGQPLPVGLEDKIPSMFTWLKTMCHPDGELSFFNDSAIGVTPSVSEIKMYGSHLELFNKEKNKDGIHLLTASGYARVQLGDAVALIDRAEVGPDHLPAHAHADTLSFELSLLGQRLIINSGTSLYGSGLKRHQERSTAAHSTIEIDEQNSSEVWSGFRVARRARISQLIEEQCDGNIRLAACHNGYKRLQGKPKHCREWIFDNSSMIINDKVTGKGIHQVKSILPLHPNVEVISVEKNKVQVDIIGNKVDITIEGYGVLNVINSNYHPEFGLSIANKHLVYCHSATLPINITTRISW